ncbi:MAG: hypothetical protein ACLQGP_39395 [Isosphaeraceae bacterium]
MAVSNPAAFGSVLTICLTYERRAVLIALNRAESVFLLVISGLLPSSWARALILAKFSTERAIGLNAGTTEPALAIISMAVRSCAGVKMSLLALLRLN